MDIAFAFDEHYADHAQVAMESVLDSQAPRDDLTFWLLTTAQVVQDRADHLHRQLDGRAKLHLLAADDGYRALPRSASPDISYITPGMHLRLLLPDLVASHTQRLLYLDCDLMVAGDLSPLWELPLGDAPLAAVRDANITVFADQGGVPGATPADDDAPYFNSGVLLMNVPAWRQQRVTEQCLTYLIEQESVLRLPDQDALNLVVARRWVHLDGKWNNMKSWFLEAPDAVPQDVRIMHFAGRNKPWNEGFYPGFRQARWRALAARVAACAPPAQAVAVAG
ncbi:UDP-D-galactose:(glucosyl)LPS alpha-1,3-D-galactosyltransferase [Allocatelliglobosispora scoriae]|uniref:UDP-D-galactose:(Glucosyl)LPS alpha-1,3-D-galactosyltransferase n=1 Tax=Allocatelliglobosispora scoriae TaxID=643052 RepID=A0A841BHU1_9ACTN|nr:glycosyltransferase family 8 protein [Allocatelliglobosispora scoriae]MBB5866746.1 UDP-D-galactose:(glucosyl)LPS alpha-1,3-D-galactosyltransferase [Allocatelliglobosispora scoriae]